MQECALFIPGKEFSFFFCLFSFCLHKFQWENVPHVAKLTQENWERLSGEDTAPLSPFLWKNIVDFCSRGKGKEQG